MEASAIERSTEYGAKSAGAKAALSAKTQRAGELVAGAQEQKGQFAEQSAEFSAKQAEMAGSEARAASQRKALDRRQQIKLSLSALQARAAASGGGASDRTVKNIGGEIVKRGEYEMLAEMHTGESEYSGYQDVDRATLHWGRCPDRGRARGRGHALCLRGRRPRRRA